ncbi:MAG: Rrf2 family transcriptional regulator [Blastopirellula sp.]|nr:MAG: Rrf2 family transcriptional regulator [Blastopirellula sp.]
MVVRHSLTYKNDNQEGPTSKVNVSAKVEYACVAMIELAARYESENTVCLRDIAESHGIPSQFLVQIMLQLKAANLVSSTRGASGGYRLQMDPRDITLGQVMEVIEGNNRTVRSNIQKPTPVSQALCNLWNEIAADQQKKLTQATLHQLAQQAVQSVEDMYYI